MNMEHSLIEQNTLFRDTSPHSLSVCEVWGHGDSLQLFFSSVGCRYRKAGYCTMCDYGGDRNITAKEAISGFQKAIKNAPHVIREILLGTCGSILDEYEMSPQVLTALLEAVFNHGIPSIVLETHYITVTETILKKIRQALPGREITIELGFESSDPKVLKNSLCKYMDLDALAGTIRLIKSFGMSPILNVFLGAPFLTTEEQIQDTEKSITWAVAHGASRVVVFPANIKPNTLLWKLYQEGKYERISHWELIDLLFRLDDALLEKVEISWYGDRQEAGKNLQVLPPSSCHCCQPVLMSFYRAFMESFDSKHRRELLNQLCNQTPCDCQHMWYQRLNGLKNN